MCRPAIYTWRSLSQFKICGGFVACWCAGTCPHVAQALGLIQHNKLHQAGLYLRRTLTLTPHCGEAHKALAYVLVETNHAAAAVHHNQEAERILGPVPAVASQKAHVLRNAVRLGDAIDAARAAVAIAADNPLNWAMLISNLHAEGLLDEMDHQAAAAVARFGNHRALTRVLAVAKMERKDWQGAIEIFDTGEVPPETDPISLFDRGRCFEALGQYDKAWRDWMRAKELQRAAGCIWDKEAAVRRFAMLADAARPRRFKGLEPAQFSAEPQPIFITGLPRSGTTMLEAALAAHPRIAGGDEMMAMPDTIQILPAILSAGVQYPMAIGALRLAQNAGLVDLLRDFYFHQALMKIGRTAKPAATWFTDKMPSNELHWPLLRLLFPASPIIATRRHPLDVVISNMSHNLVHGGFISCSLEGFAANMVMVAALHDTYLARVPGLAAQVRRVRYESFCADPHAGIDAIMPPGLAADPACYDFHRSAWRSRTISHRQIKQPVHDKSIGRYKPFVEFLKPILGELAPLIERQGYGI